MKKISLFMLLFVLSISLISCGSLESTSEIMGGIVEAEKPLKLEDSRNCNGCTIKFLDDNLSSNANYYITPNGFEMDKLAEKGYYMTITVTYKVKYTKDYDVLLDIGYAGSPKYEVSITNSDGLGRFQEDLPTTKTAVEKTISYTQSVSDLKSMRLILSFSTDNVQNRIHFSDIVVEYKCYKY